jgi:hypothetical protein
MAAKDSKGKKAIGNQLSQKEIDAKLKALDQIGDDGEDSEVTPPGVTVEEEDPLEPEKDDDEVDENGNPIKPTPPVAPAKPDEPKIDYEARYKGSTQEAQILKAKNDQFMGAVVDAKNIPEPTEAELKEIYGPDNWDLMDTVQKTLARENLIAKRRFEKIGSAVEATQKSEEWVGKVSAFANNPENAIKYPALDGHEADFIRFCSLPSRVGVNFDDLVKAFSFDTKPIAKRATILVPGAGGPEGAKPQNEALTPKEIAYYRKNDQKKYKELIRSGKIKVEL